MELLEANGLDAVLHVPACKRRAHGGGADSYDGRAEVSEVRVDAIILCVEGVS